MMHDACFVQQPPEFLVKPLTKRNYPWRKHSLPTCVIKLKQNQNKSQNLSYIQFS